MPECKARVYLDNVPATNEQLRTFKELRVDQGIGLAAEAELDLPIETDGHGVWPGIEESYAQPFARVRIEIKVGSADYVPLIDGPVVGTRYRLEANPQNSQMTLIVHDDSVLLNRDEKVALFEDMAPQNIVSALFSEAGLEAEVDAAPDAGSALQRVVVQRGTGMQLARELAKRFGMFVYVRPGDTPGSSVGMFKRAAFPPTELPELLLLGNERNIVRFEVEYDALKPTTARAGSVDAATRAVLTSQASSADIAPLGEQAVHTLLQPGTTLLRGTREEQSDLDAAAAAAVNVSSWAYAANGEVDANDYSGVMRPYGLVRVRGTGGFLSGDYLIGRVNHVINHHGYRQRFALHRNARLSGGLAGSAAGGAAAGVF